MTPFIADEDFTLYVGNCLDVLRELPDESVDCCVTSPPYWGLRDYGTEPQVWGGDHRCAHEWDERSYYRAMGTAAASSEEGFSEAGEDNAKRLKDGRWRNDATCAKCGAWLGQLGLEATPQEFVAHLVELFREVRRILSKHGTLWLNLGDSYIGGGRGGKDGDQLGDNSIAQAHHDAGVRWGPPTGKVEGLKHKDLAGIPWRVAFALQDDGWWLRNDNIWSKPNPMPESVTDRTTKSHEYVFMFSKSGTPQYWTNPMSGMLSASKPEPDLWWFPPVGVYGQPSSDKTLVEQQREHFTRTGWKRRNVWEGHDYFYDQEPTREDYAASSEERYRYAFGGDKSEAMAESGYGKTRPIGMRDFPGAAEPPPTLGDLPPEAERGPDGRRKTTVQQGDNSIQPRDGERWANAGRNMRTVWEITVQPYRDAHFATFPTELPRRCIVTGCPEFVCRTCGKPRERLFVKTKDDDALKGTNWDDTYEKPEGDDHGRSVSEMYRDALTTRRVFVGWSDCGHDDYRRGIVMDPFMGSGTTAKVARDNERHALGIELNEEYAQLIADRTRQLSLIGGT